MRLSSWMLLGFFLFICHIFIPILFYIGLSLVVIYWCFRLYKKLRWMSAPKGKRIKHKALKGYLTSNYGVKEGSRMYRDTVKELKDKGYF